MKTGQTEQRRLSQIEWSDAVLRDECIESAILNFERKSAPVLVAESNVYIGMDSLLGPIDIVPTNSYPQSLVPLRQMIPSRKHQRGIDILGEAANHLNHIHTASRIRNGMK
jgi:hypothetical protein